MYLTFTSKGHETKVFTTNLLKSNFIKRSDIPRQVITYYSSKRPVGIERKTAYAGEMQYFNQGAYNQANGNSTNSETYNGDIDKQYTNGSYAEVWFKEAKIGKGVAPNKTYK